MGKPEIEQFIAALPRPWQRQVCTNLLESILAAAPDLELSIKWGNPFFAYHGAVLKWFVAKEWINVYFYKGSQLADPEGLFIPTDNTAMRTIRLFEKDVFPKKALVEMVKRAKALQTQP